jgi:tetratricopeptide (TPR) repeat protein
MSVRAVIMALCAGVSAAVTPVAVFAAQEVPCSTYVALCKSMSIDTAQPDSIRAASFGRLADYAFAGKEYGLARDDYAKAAALDNKNTRYAWREGLAALADGDTNGAIKTFTRFSGDNDPALSNGAKIALGRIAYARGDFDGAMKYFRQTGPFKTANGWSLPASLGKLLCARALGLADTAAFYEKQLSPYASTMLEKDDLAKVKFAPFVAKKAAAPSPKPVAVDTEKKPAPVAPDSAEEKPYTLQVGAFASEPSALALKKSLAKQFKEVRCVTAIVSARTFYRVWVGNFKTREEAEKFGRDELVQLGLAFRVVAQ